VRALVDGVQAEGTDARVVEIYSTSDCGFIGHAGAQLSGSGISIGIQSKGTTVIHRHDLEPLNNLELFRKQPLTLDSYRSHRTECSQVCKENRSFRYRFRSITWHD
jgi:propanediol dehydratase medium subunit